MEYEKCYVFEPAAERPAKRRKVRPLQGLQASWPARRKAYEKAWKETKEGIDAWLSESNTASMGILRDWLDEKAQEPESSTLAGKIPTGIISAGPSDVVSHGAIIDRLAEAWTNDETPDDRRLFIALSASASPNLKATLKHVNQTATAALTKDASANADADDSDDDAAVTSTAPRKARRHLSYDLQILHDHVRTHSLRQVVLAIRDTEAFDSTLLSELIALLAAWRDRIPVVLFFSLATDVELLQQRLSKTAVKSLDGKLFDVREGEGELERLFAATVRVDTPLWVGAELMGMALERRRDFIRSGEAFVDAVQYAFMAGYYANALTLFLDDGVRFKDVPKDHFEAARNLPSFRQFARGMLDEGKAGRVRELLDNDKALFEVVKQKVADGQRSLADIMAATHDIHALQSGLQSVAVTTKSKLYVQALSNKLQGSTLLRTLLLSIRRAPSNIALALMANIRLHHHANATFAKRLQTLHKTLTDLLAARPPPSPDTTTPSSPLRSADDLRTSTLRTTITAQKIALTKSAAALSASESTYTDLLRDFTDLLTDYFAATLLAPSSLPFHEIFLYDAKSPTREVMAPRVRHAAERALACPWDYLDCACCGPGHGDGDGDGDDRGEVPLAPSQPGTAVLYQLYLESGALINVRDLWEAFRAVVGSRGDGEGAGGDGDGEMVMGMFQRGMAELRYLGLVRGTRKRVDHVAKVGWRGL